MNPKLADTLVLVFSQGASLRGWEQSGRLGREWAMIRGLLECYAQVVFVTYGDADEEMVLRRTATEDEAARIAVIANSRGLAAGPYSNEIVRGVVAECAGPSVVVRTSQMAGGEVAVRLTHALRAVGKTVGLVARGGSLWTRFVAHEHGPHSREAVESAVRERVLCCEADVVVGTTAEMVQDLAWRYGLDPARTAVIPNYVVSDGALGEPQDREKGLLLYAGKLTARKRVGLLIEALALLPETTRAGVKLEIVGEGPQQAELEQLAARLGTPVVFRRGLTYDQLRERMSRCELFLHASELEGHPKLVLEAMACGAAAVVTDAPGLAEVVEHGLTGLRLAPEARTMALAIGELLADPEWRGSIGTAAARAARGTYALPAVLKKEAAAHALALSHGRGRGEGFVTRMSA
jgi:glycosyltransferase involved in cell wall biosynthesis